MNQFIGMQEIEAAVESKEKTPAGAPVLLVTFKGGKTSLIPKRMFEKIASDKALEPSELRTRRVVAIVSDIIEVIAEWDMELGEWDHVRDTIKMSMDENYSRAQEVLWKTDRKTWLDIFRVLRDAGQKLVEK